MGSGISNKLICIGVTEIKFAESVQFVKNYALMRLISLKQILRYENSSSHLSKDSAVTTIYHCDPPVVQKARTHFFSYQ